MRANACSAPRRRSSSPASSAESCAASCCARSRVGPQFRHVALQLLDACLRRLDAPPRSRTASSRRCSRKPSFVVRAHRDCARSAASTPAAAAPAAGLPSPSAAAPRSGSRSRARPRAALPTSHRAPASAPPAVFASAALRISACPSSRSTSPSFCCVSRSSRFSASGPSAPGLPPVTVTLWKHSPEGARKNAADSPAPASAPSPNPEPHIPRAAWAESLPATAQIRPARECSCAAAPPAAPMS